MSLFWLRGAETEGLHGCEEAVLRERDVSTDRAAVGNRRQCPIKIWSSSSPILFFNFLRQSPIEGGSSWSRILARAYIYPTNRDPSDRYRSRGSVHSLLLPVGLSNPRQENSVQVGRTKREDGRRDQERARLLVIT